MPFLKKNGRKTKRSLRIKQIHNRFIKRKKLNFKILEARFKIKAQKGEKKSKSNTEKWEKSNYVPSLGIQHLYPQLKTPHSF